jgi:S1-C subfamily serine protease
MPRRSFLVTYRKWIPIAAAVLAALPVSLAAQRTPRPSPPPLAFVLADDNRGRIGVVVNTRPDPDADKLGAKLEGVTPGGPAAKAGLKVGDIITRFNGTALAGLKAEDEQESGPGTKLVQLARKLEPGDTVQIEYRRGSDAKKATLVAEELGWAPNITMMPRMPDMQHFEFSFGMPWGDLELVSLNPDLGEYFGAKEGVLVVKAPADSSLPLKSGDVILKIGDRTPASPSHAMKILRSYETGESVNIEIMRKQKRTTITWKVPEREAPRLWNPGRRTQENKTDVLRDRLRARAHVQRV